MKEYVRRILEVYMCAKVGFVLAADKQITKSFLACPYQELDELTQLSILARMYQKLLVPIHLTLCSRYVH